MRSNGIKILSWSGLIFLPLAMILALVFLVRPPGEPLSREAASSVPDAGEPYISEGDLPGITWSDDIHPIFTRNTCIACHTRGREALAEGFEEFALGLIDPEDKLNPFYSYHELVYAEGSYPKMEGEKFRDGQCCWPRDFPMEQQRRIWVGRADRSAIIRKLERDYYDWRKPPRYFEEGLRLSWGLPMPMFHHEEDDHYYEIRPFYERILFGLSLWLGGGRDKLRQWPPRISARDQALLRYWIDHSLQLTAEGTVIEARVRDAEGKAVPEATVVLVGNYNSPARRKVMDRIALRTDETGKASLSFPRYSVLTSFWYAAAERNGRKAAYQSMKVIPGGITRITLTLPR